MPRICPALLPFAARLPLETGWHDSRKGANRPLSETQMRAANAVQPSESCCLIVMETGSRWPTWLEAPPESRIVVQDPLESLETLTTRALRVIEGLRAKGKRLQTLVIAAGRASEGERALRARSQLARAARAAMTDDAGLVLAGNDGLPDRVRHELFTTVEVIAQAVAGSAIDVRVRFDTADGAERHPVSGVYPALKVESDANEIGVA
jgi:hypothetical protein